MRAVLLILIVTAVPGFGSLNAQEASRSWMLADGSMQLGRSVGIDASKGFVDWHQAKTDDDVTPQVFINGLVLPDANLRLVDPDKNRFEFFLDRKLMNSQMWQAIRTRTGGEPLGVRRVHLSFGDSGQISGAAGSARVEFVLLDRRTMWRWGVIAFALIMLFTILSIKSNILRDGPVAPGTSRPPMSLARTQMAIWLFLVIIAYVWIWLITDELNTITPTVLGLMGISAGTYLSAAMIDQTSSNRSPDPATVDVRIEQVRQSIAELDQRQASLPAGSDLEAIHDERHELVTQKKLLEKNVALPRQSRAEAKRDPRAIVQLLSDNTGVRLHRFQIFAWTIVLGAIFMTKALTELSMPEFSPYLLGVMGISSGTYLGFKFPEVSGE